MHIWTNENWVHLMYQAMDSNGIDQQPARDSNKLMAWYFVLVITVGVIFLTTLVYAIIINNFKKMKDQDDTFITKEQK